MGKKNNITALAKEMELLIKNINMAEQLMQKHQLEGKTVINAQIRKYIISIAKQYMAMSMKLNELAYDCFVKLSNLKDLKDFREFTESQLDTVNRLTKQVNTLAENKIYPLSKMVK